jgi:hypothetical protein
MTADAPPGPRGRRHRRIGASVALVVAGLVAAGCGIPTDHSPRLLDRRDMPAALSAGTTTTLVHPTGGFQSTRIFLVHSTPTRTVLQPVTVQVAEKATIAAQAEAALQVLIADQPASRAATANLTNVIPSNTRILGASLDGDVLDLDLSHFDTQIVSTQQKLVFVAVKFSLAGQAAQVQLDSGTSTAGAAIRREDYRQLYTGR